MPATARCSKSEAYEKGIREGAAMARRSRNMEPPEEEEEEEEEMDMALQPGHSRKRSAKGAKNTKPAADGYGMKKPMDAECGCSDKKGGKCDGNCGSMRQRGDSLSPLEYLDACELGIQDRSHSYIRARLDAAERLDLKCGKGSISEGEKCTKGAAQKAEPNTRKGVTGKALLTAGLAVGGGYLALKHGRSAVKEVKEIGGSVKSLMEKKAKLRALQAQNKRMGVQGEGENSFTRFLDRVAPDKRRKALERAFKKPDAKRPRRDSVYAAGFSPELDQLAI